LLAYRLIEMRAGWLLALHLAACSAAPDGDGHSFLDSGPEKGADAGSCVRLDGGVSSGGWTLEAVDRDGLRGWNPSLALAPDREIEISYRDWSDNSLWLARRTATGWERQPVPDASATGATSIAVGRDGVVHILYASPQGVAHAFQVGAEWQIEPVGPDAMFVAAVSLAVAADGTLHASWSSSAGARYATRSPEPGWVAETVDGEARADLALALDPGDRVHIAYRCDGCGGVRHAVRDHGAWLGETVQGGATAGPSMAIGSDDEIHILFIADGELMDAIRAGTTWTTETIDPQPGADSSSVAVDRDGIVHVSYFHSGDLRYAERAGGVWSPELVDGEGPNAGYFSSLALDDRDRVHIAYFHEGALHDTDLRHAGRADEGCRARRSDRP
jgi:hypothetical protein